MKNFISLSLLFVSIAFTVNVSGQTLPVAKSQTSAYSAEEMKSRVSEINKELQKMDRTLLRVAREQKVKEQIVRESERELSYNRQKQQERTRRIATLKTEMEGHNLQALNDKIDRIEKEKSKLDRQSRNDAQSIVRKKAQIEKLLGEISMLESRIATNEETIDRKEEEIHDTQDVITLNGLVAKQTEIDAIDKEIQSLKSAENRLQRKQDQSQDSVSESENRIQALEIQRKMLLNEKVAKEQMLNQVAWQ
ncbi:MAG: hypothetical protein GC193_04735 [Cryomorphaceae bacterium]|nr:hypothetical protein [Cryomorphaceae bacterium]